MSMNIFESILYGIISGLCEFLPVSSQSHQMILHRMFGIYVIDPVRNLFIHIALLFGIYSACRSMIDHLRRERRQNLHSRRKNSHTSRVLLEERFVKNAALPMLIGYFVLYYTLGTETNLLLSALFLLLNGLILFISGRMLQGNKEIRSMTYLDSLLIGISGAFSAIPGISRIGCITTISAARGADRQHALNWAIMLSAPALVLLGTLDVVQLISNGGSVPFWVNFIPYLFSAIGAYVGGYYSIRLMRFLAVRTGYSGLSYYCWGAALFSFLIYLTVV